MAGLLAVSAVFVYLTKDHWWKRLSSARVIYNGQEIVGVGTYRSPSGELLVNLKDIPNEGVIFIVYPTERKVGLPNDNHFVILPGFVFSRYVSPMVVFMKSAKAETDPNVVAKPDSVEFTTLSGKRVQIIIN
jgi:hypothetical protein